jgi:large subunit ribosomal protein L32
VPVPKRKLSRSRRDMKHANKHLHPQIATICKQESCGNAILPHTVCSACGFHKGIQILSIKQKKATVSKSE